MRRIPTLSFFALMAAIALPGCPADPLPYVPLPDVDVPDVLPRDGQPVDMPELDMQVVDAEIIVDLEVDQAPPPDFGLPDLPDPGVPPSLDDTVVLTGRNDTWVGWIIAQRLYALRIDTREAAVDPVEGEPMMPSMDAPMLITPLPALDEPLIGVRAPNGRPWVLISDGGGGMIRAHDLSGGIAPRPLRLWAPVRTAVSGESILIVGRTGPEATDPVASVLLEDGGPRDPVVDKQGIALPVAISPGLGAWIFGFDDGICQIYEPDIDPATDPEPGSAWRCATQPDITLIGDSRHLYSVGDIGGNLRAWTSMPGAARTPPDDVLEDDPREAVLGLDADARRLHGITGGHAMLVETDEGSDVYLLEPDRISSMPAPDGVLVLGATRFFQSRFLVVWDTEGAQPRLLPTDAVEGPLSPVDALECNPLPLPEKCDDADDFVDLDCVNGRENGRCCRERAPGTLETTELNLTSEDPELADPPATPWFIARTPGGLLMLAAFSDPDRDVTERLDILRVRTGSSTDNDADGVRLARYDDIYRIDHFGQSQGQIVIHGYRRPAAADPEPDAGVPDAGVADAGPAEPIIEDVLAWYLVLQNAETEEFETVITTTETPCTPVLRLAMREDAARVYCTEGAYDVPYDIDGPRVADAVSLPYPGGDVRWIGPDLLDGIDARFLVATGDDYTLRIWSDTTENTPIADGAMPERLSALTVDERQHAIRLPEDDGVHIARLREGHLEIYFPGIGWRPGPSTRWPHEAGFSRTSPVALTIAEITDPTSPDYIANQRRYVPMLHALRVDELHWGQPVVIGQDPDDPSLVGIYYRGVRLSDYDSGDPLLWSATGQNARILLRPRGVLCNAAVLGN